jgi:hypothetical protein
MNCSSANHYYLLRKEQEPILWDINDLSPRPEPDLFWMQSDFCGRILQILEQRLGPRELTFYITFDEVKALPSYGSSVVVIITGDEACHIPLYAHKVLAVFKPYGTDLFLGPNPFRYPSYQNWMNCIQFLKNWVRRISGMLNDWMYNFGRHRRHVFPIPLGYYKQLELPIRPFTSRSCDIFFAGSVHNDTYPQKSLKSWMMSWLKAPKTLSRQQMVLQVNLAQRNHPEWKLELVLTSGFFSTPTNDASHYSRQLMNAKICLDPRGTSFETYRFFEAMRYGCIVISESLPSRWFYDGSPAIIIEDWRNLEQVLAELLNHPELMLQKHLESLRWWEEKCSPQAAAKYIVRQLCALNTSLAKDLSPTHGLPISNSR